MSCVQFLPELIASVAGSAASIYATVVTAVASVIMAIAAVFMACFAHQQHKLDANRIRVELYSRRLRVYKAVKAFIWEALTRNVSDREAIVRLHRETEHAAFLFPEASQMKAYIESLYEHGEDLLSTEKQICSDQERTSEKQEELVRNETAVRDWFRAQSRVVEEKFRPFLDLCSARQDGREHGATGEGHL